MAAATSSLPVLEQQQQGAPSHTTAEAAAAAAAAYDQDHVKMAKIPGSLNHKSSLDTLDDVEGPMSAPQAGLLSGMTSWLSRTLSLASAPSNEELSSQAKQLPDSPPRARESTSESRRSSGVPEITVSSPKQPSDTRRFSNGHAAGARNVLQKPRHPQQQPARQQNDAADSQSGFWPSLNLASLVPRMASSTINFVPHNGDDEAEDDDDDQALTREEQERALKRRSRDLRIEQANANGEHFVSDPEASPLVDSVPERAQLRKRPSLAFVNATQAGYANPLTLQLVARQGGEKVAMDLERGFAERERRMSSMDSATTVTARKASWGVLAKTDSPKGSRAGSLSRRDRTTSATEEQQRIIEEGDDNGIVQSPTADEFDRTSPFAPESPSKAPAVLKKPPPLGDERVPSPVEARKKSFFNRFSKRRNASSVSVPTPVETQNLTVEDPVPASARLRSASEVKSKGKVKIRTVKTKTKGKANKDFDKLFLAQELVIPAQQAFLDQSSTGLDFVRTATVNSTSSDRSAEEIQPTVQKKPYAVWACEFSHDGQYLAVAGRDRVVRIWAVVATEEKRQAALSPELVEVERSRNPDPSKSQPCVPPPTPSTAKSTAEHVLVPQTSIMPVFDPKPVREYKGHTGDILDLAWSKNNFLLSSSMDKTVRLWHVSREDCLCAFEHVDFVTSIAFHPRDDRFFVSGSLDCKLRIWNIPQKKIHLWTELPELITTVSFTKDGSRIVAGTFLGNCLFFRSDTCELEHRLECKDKSKGRKITNVASFPRATNKDLLLISSNDSKLRLYNANNKVIETKFSGHENSTSQIRATFSEDGRFVVSGSEDGHVYVWDSNVVRERQNGGSWRILAMKGSPGHETFGTDAHVNTCALFAPAATRKLLSAAGDPVLAGKASKDEDRDSVILSMNNTMSKGTSAAVDAIIVVADDSRGIISIYRNSEIPDSIKSPRKGKK